MFVIIFLRVKQFFVRLKTLYLLSIFDGILSCGIFILCKDKLFNISHFLVKYVFFSLIHFYSSQDNEKNNKKMYLYFFNRVIELSTY